MTLWNAFTARRDSAEKNSVHFVTDFKTKYHEAAAGVNLPPDCLRVAHDATLHEYAEVWNDSANMESALSYLLFGGAQNILEDNYDGATAILARKRIPCSCLDKRFDEVKYIPKMPFATTHSALSLTERWNAARQFTVVDADA
eukprot:scaffold10135_cov113-Skeletonema_dohrnii-CCMP3373.AAC.2